MGVVGDLLVVGAKKGAKIYAKKKVEDFSETIEEVNTWTSLNPLKARELNKGEDERVRKRDEEWKRKKEENFKKNQTPIPMSKDEVKELMKTDAYNNKYNPNHEKVQRQVRKAFEALYPEKGAKEDTSSKDDRNENPENYYIWKTVGDGRTRSLHAERDGEVFCWDNPPEGGHPGEDYGCRCEAEPYVPKEESTKIKRQTPMMRYEDYDEEIDDDEEFENIIQTPRNKSSLKRVNILDNIVIHSVRKVV